MRIEPDIECPFKWGDLIDHKLFGFGTVNGEVQKTNGFDSLTYKTVSKGWIVPVKWDDEERAEMRVESSALSLVSRPDSKGSQYWNNEYSKLLEVVKETRAITDINLLTAFRPNEKPIRTSLDKLLELENNALKRLRDFIAEDEKGNHP